MKGLRSELARERRLSAHLQGLLTGEGEHVSKLRVLLVQERSTSKRLAAHCAEQAVVILRLSGRLAAIRHGWGMMRAIKRGLIRGFARGFGGAP